MATDGAEHPLARQITRAARNTVSAGQTFDVEISVPDNAPPGLALRITPIWYPTDARRGQPTPVVHVPIVVGTR
jgi:hypothetical protein